MNITKIPEIMRANRMPVGSTLMLSWFLRPTAIAPNYGTTDWYSVKMKWALGFKRAKAVYDEIINGKIWVNYAAKKVIEKKLKEKGLLGAAPQNFGDLSKYAWQLDEDQINQRVIGMSDTLEMLDDMDAALGRFVFQIAIAGTVSPRGAVHQVDVKEVGIYIKDSYDFNEFQYLGCWDEAKTTVSRNPLASGESVLNSTFREWRQHTGMGGDFMIYSDVTRITLSPPDSFDIPVPPPPPSPPDVSPRSGMKW